MKFFKNIFRKPKTEENQKDRSPIKILNEDRQTQYIEVLHKEMELLNQESQYKKGINCCDKALKINQYDYVAWRYKGLMQRNIGESKNGTFRESQAREDKEKALTYWENALDDPWSLYYYGSTLWELNRIKESIPYLKKSLNNPPNQTIQDRVKSQLYFYEDLVKNGRI